MEYNILILTGKSQHSTVKVNFIEVKIRV